MIIPVILVLLVASAEAFAPVHKSTQLSTTARAFGVDPSFFHTTQQHISSITDALSSISIADAAPDVVDAVAVVAKDDGWFGFLTGPTESVLIGIHSLVSTIGPNNAWGISIIVLTLIIKALTFPLTKTQLESTNKMQAMQPAIKELQAKYQSNPEVMNQKIAEFYQVNEINPLAGCIPSLIQIPVFIGLYRAVLNLAAENRLNEPFLWLPSLQGPTYGSDPTAGASWLLSGWVDGTPSLGWDETIAFLILPVFLVLSQYISMELMQPKSDDPAVQQSNLILKVLPLMIGWFSLSVPSALCVYWFINNIVTTATSVIIRSTMTTTPAKTGPSNTSAAVMQPPPASIFAPPREKPAGFGDVITSRTNNEDGVRPITAIDAEVVEEQDENDGPKQFVSQSQAPNKKSGRKSKKSKK